MTQISSPSAHLFFGKINLSLASPKNVAVIDGDVLDRLVCLKAFSHNPDIVIHLATYPRAKIVDSDPILGIPKVINTTTNLYQKVSWR